MRITVSSEHATKPVATWSLLDDMCTLHLHHRPWSKKDLERNKDSGASRRATTKHDNGKVYSVPATAPGCWTTSTRFPLEVTLSPPPHPREDSEICSSSTACTGCFEEKGKITIARHQPSRCLARHCARCANGAPQGWAWWRMQKWAYAVEYNLNEQQNCFRELLKQIELPHVSPFPLARQFLRSGRQPSLSADPPANYANDKQTCEV